MNKGDLKQKLKPWMLPIAMAGGMLFHGFIDKIAFLAPYLIFVMLLITFCKVRPSEFRVTRLSWSLLGVQLLGSLAVFFLLRPVGEDIAQGAFICVFCPTATAAPVITGMLGGSVARVATYSIVSNLSVAVLAPVLFEYMGGASVGGQVAFFDGFITICYKVGPLIIAPLLVAGLMSRTVPRVHHAIASHQSLSFYIWAVSLFIVVGRAVSFVMSEPADKIPEMIVLALVSMLMCCVQFYLGRRIGRRFGDKIAGAQGLGQKNTVLAIWMALTFLNPISSVGPAAYVAWQNTINSAQLYFYARKRTKVKAG